MSLTSSPYHEYKLDRSQKLIIVIFLVTVTGWLTTSLSGLSAATVALVPVIGLFVLGLLEVDDLAKISWPTLLLFGGGLSLGSAVNQVGIDSWLAGLVQESITGIPLFAVLLMLPLADELGLDLKSMVMLIAIGVSLDFMMPVGTPPSALAYSTGVVNVRQMMKNGFLVNLGTGLILVLLYYFFYL